MVAVPGLIAALKGKQDKGLQELRVKLQRIEDCNIESSIPSVWHKNSLSRMAAVGQLQGGAVCRVMRSKDGGAQSPGIRTCLLSSRLRDPWQITELLTLSFSYLQPD